jgi:maltose O-acetyltransferase
VSQSVAHRIARRALFESVTRSRIAYYRLLSTGWFEGHAPVLVCPALVLGAGRVRAEGATLGVWPSPDMLDGCVHLQTTGGAEIVIGAGTTVNCRTKLIAEGPGIEIGRRVLIGRHTEIWDSDRHDLDPSRRESGTPEMGRVIVEDGVFVGAGVKIGKGVRIGRDSVVGMGSVLVDDVPAGVVAAGNPCRVIRGL